MSDNIYLDGRYLSQNPTWHVEDSPWKAVQIVRLIQKHNLDLITIGEVGCGAGEILNQLYQLLPKTIRFHGYEISPQAFSVCQARQKNRLSFYLGDLLEEEVEPFDLLLTIDVFEHVENYLGFLRKLRAKGKIHIFHIPLDNSVSSVLRSKSLIQARRKLGHLHYFTKETALATLTDTGYKVFDYMYTAGAVEIPTHSYKRKIMSLPRNVCYRFSPDFTARVLGGYSLLVLAE